MMKEIIREHCYDVRKTAIWVGSLMISSIYAVTGWILSKFED